MPFVDNQGTRVYFELEGAGPPLVLQHGLSDSLEGWREYGYVEALRARHRLILIDARGHGRSDKPHDPEAYELERRAGDVTAVLDAVGVSQAGFYGYSMGGRIGFGLLRYAPERLRSLFVGGAHPYAARSAFFRSALAGGLEAWLSVVEHELGEPVPPPTRRRILGNDLQALRASVATDGPPVFDAMPATRVPCSLVVGGSDPSLGLVERCARELEGAGLVVLPGRGHFQAIRETRWVVPLLDGEAPSSIATGDEEALPPAPSA